MVSKFSYTSKNEELKFLLMQGVTTKLIVFQKIITQKQKNVPAEMFFIFQKYIDILFHFTSFLKNYISWTASIFLHTVFQAFHKIYENFFQHNRRYSRNFFTYCSFLDSLNFDVCLHTPYFKKSLKKYWPLLIWVNAMTEMCLFLAKLKSYRTALGMLSFCPLY